MFLAGCNSSSTLESNPIQKQVTIKRDNFGTPHFYADKTFGLFYGYGYAVATDRLFQMESPRADFISHRMIHLIVPHQL